MAQIAVSTARDTRIIGLVSFGHMLSHFYFLVIPPILILLKADIEASYLGFGVILGAFSLSSFILQTPIGFLVDRIGAVKLLGLSLIETAAIGLMGFRRFVLAAPRPLFHRGHRQHGVSPGRLRHPCRVD